ncbi:chorismate-binding protein [uncultured Polaribacter sp.]|uniref:chorismate-binding protein n=1 Tax=uncultured Polaribacter sp. TaxID=174711 RepID=UPI00262B01AF|nr:chorismate-binding protein [uncultured Polaribacter sp.]
MNILHTLENFYRKKLPFVIYRKPNSNIASGLFLKDDSLFFTSDFSEPGFVFSPFDSNQKSIIFFKNKADYFEEGINLDEISLSKNVFGDDILSKENHINIVEKAIEKIKKNDFKKVVISRSEIVKLSSVDISLIYQKLLQNYPNAFVYVWYHPKVGLWFGATPETLLNIENSKFKTMSLAGTQINQGLDNVIWKSKELEEQQLVTNFIETQLKEISLNLKVDKTETVKAGNLLHLRTKINGALQEKASLKTLIRALHPTPAVCGLPRNEAKEFILKNENYNRSFYTGFLGEINFNDVASKSIKSSLFVNLRCMKVDNNTAQIFIGGGITKESNSEKEWEETLAKSKVMKIVL